MDLELEGKTALVTGGSRGIGKAIAPEMATCGCSVELTARGVEALDLSARELGQETGQQVTGIPCDLTSTDVLNGAADIKERCRAKYGNNVVVHVPIPSAVIVCTPPANVDYTCGDTPWVVTAENSSPSSQEARFSHQLGGVPSPGRRFFCSLTRQT